MGAACAAMWWLALIVVQDVGPVDPDRPRPCPEAQEDEVLVCGDPPRSPYRLVPELRRRTPINRQGDYTVIRERMRWIEGDPMDYMGYCSPVGPNGWQGCMFEEWKDQRQEKGLAY